MFLKQKKLLRKKRLSHSGDWCTELPVQWPRASKYRHTNQSDNLLIHRYSWPNSHKRQVPGEQHCSNHRSANGLCYPHTNYCRGMTLIRRSTPIPLLTHFPPSAAHRQNKEQSKESCGSNKNSLKGEGKRGHTTPKAASDSKSLTSSHKCGYPSRNNHHGKYSNTPILSFFYPQFLLPSKQS